MMIYWEKDTSYKVIIFNKSVPQYRTKKKMIYKQNFQQRYWIIAKNEKRIGWMTTHLELFWIPIKWTKHFWYEYTKSFYMSVNNYFETDSHVKKAVLFSLLSKKFQGGSTERKVRKNKTFIDRLTFIPSEKALLFFSDK